VLVVDDHPLVLKGVRSALGREAWVARVLEAATLPEAFDLARRYEPHVIVCDLFFGDHSGIELGRRLTREVPAARLILMSGAGRLSPQAARAAGAAAFVPKDWPAARFAGAVRIVANGGTVLPSRQAQAAPALDERERLILELVADGRTNPEIGAVLHLSPHTVKKALSRVLRRLGARNRAQAVQSAQQLGLL
jgi:two-component system response regulator DesR